MLKDLVNYKLDSPRFEKQDVSRKELLDLILAWPINDILSGVNVDQYILFLWVQLNIIIFLSL